MKFHQLFCNGKTDPIGISPDVHFQWNYVGSGKRNEKQTAFRLIVQNASEQTVFDSKNVTAKVAPTDSSIRHSIISAARAEEMFFPKIIINDADITDTSIGSLPLHGIKEFVSTASMRSLFESIILEPLIPTALQPRPIHIINACLPQAPQAANGRSRL